MSDEILIQARAMTDMRDQRINALQADLRESNQLAADNFERAKRAEAEVARLRAIEDWAWAAVEEWYAGLRSPSKETWAGLIAALNGTRTEQSANDTAKSEV